MTKISLAHVSNISGQETSAINTINTDLDEVVTAFDNTLSRDGTSPNTMQADIDMNNNDLLNVANITATNVTVNGVAFGSGVSAVGPAGWSPVFAVVSDTTRRVLQLVAYVGGAGTSPTTYLNYYVGASGMTNVLASAVDIRGSTGAGTGDMLKSTYDAANISQQLLGTTATQTVTNKSLSDTTTKIVNVSDATKVALLDSSLIKTGTTRTLSVPDKSGTIALTSDVPFNYLSGCTLSNDGTTPASKIGISAGNCADSTNFGSMTLAAVTKDITAAWAVGTGGSLDTGVVSNNWYHVYIIKRVDTGVVDVLTSLSATAPTLPTNYTLFRRVGSVNRTGGSNVLFVQDGDHFYYNTTSPPLEYSSSGTRGKAALSVTTPLGVRVRAIFNGLVGNSTTGGVIVQKMVFFDGLNTNISKTVGIGVQNNNAGYSEYTVEQFTNLSSQIQLQCPQANYITCTVNTIGYVDRRGQ